MSLIDFRRRCEKIDHIVSNPNLPIRDNVRSHTHSITGDDFMLNDWYFGYYYGVYEKVKKNDGSDYADGDKIAIASDSASLVQKIELKSNGKILYDSDDLNYYMVTKNILEYSKPYANSVGTTSFFYPDKVRGTDINEFTLNGASHAVEKRNDLYNENYKKRMAITKNGDIHFIFELRNCEFFSSFYNQIMPPSNLDITITLSSNETILHRDAADAGILKLKNLWLCYDKLTLNPSDNEKFIKMLKTPTEVTYLKEMIYINPGLKHKQYSYPIVNNILKPRHLIIFFSWTENANNQTKNSFENNTSDMSIVSANIRLNNYTYLPSDTYDCINKTQVVYRSLLQYMNQKTPTPVYIDYDLFKTCFMYLYFDIYSNITDVLKEGNNKIEFNYMLANTPPKEYSIFALLLSENTFKLSVINNRTEIIK